MSDTYYQPKAHTDASKQSQTGRDLIPTKPRKEVSTSWSDLVGIGKEKKPRRTEQGIDDNS